jgi:hypothetical protein
MLTSPNHQLKIYEKSLFILITSPLINGIFYMCNDALSPTIRLQILRTLINFQLISNYLYCHSLEWLWTSYWQNHHLDRIWMESDPFRSRMILYGLRFINSCIAAVSLVPNKRSVLEKILQCTANCAKRKYLCYTNTCQRRERFLWFPHMQVILYSNSKITIIFLRND